MAIWRTVLICLLFAAGHLILLTKAANVALFKHTTANSTCGSPTESFYSVVERSKSPRQRTVSHCDASSPTLSHNASKMVDGNFRTWWQSSASVDKVFIAIDLRGQHQKYYYVNKLVIKFGEYYRPGQLAFYKSSDYGQSYQPWHYFVSSTDECQEKFNVPVQNNPVRVDQVLCMVYPTESIDRNDVVSLFVVGPRGDVNNPSDKLLNWMNVTNVRLNFMTLTRIFDVLAVKWHHYAVREVEVDAYCLCNGQGNGLQCFYNATLGDNQCKCQEGACGIDCGTCCPAYNQYPWKPGNRGPLVADPDAACQLCNCHNHSAVCVYNETVAQMNKSLDIHGSYSGGGVCQHCQDNTEGINCEVCKPFYFRPRNTSHWDRDACKGCNCSIKGTENTTLPGVLYLDCLRDERVVPPRPGMEPGDCICKNNTMGRRCDLCKPGYHNLSAENPEGCQECTCHQPGTVNGSNVCEPGVDGHCTCKRNVEGLRCSTCKDTYYDLRQDNSYGCTECACDVGGAYGPVCNKTSGQCECKGDITQRQCDSPQSGFYFPTLHFISSARSDVLTVQQGNKTWTTTVNIIRGVNSSGWFTLILSYTSASSVRVEITTESKTAEVSLNSCPQRCYFNLSTLFGEMSLTAGAVVVNVTYEASVTQFTPINVVALPQEFYQPMLLRNSTGQDFLANCSVVDNNMGVGTDREEFCLAQVFSLTVNYLGRALPCGCHATGSVNSTCQKYGGQCHCKPGVTGRTCDKCIAGFYNFSSQGCSACGCDGENKVCDAASGQCVCPPNTVGRTCDQCNGTFWGWNETVGCQACNCSSTGSSNLQCNLTTGVCSCQPGVQGAKCTECMNGYKNFSSQGCSLCSCDGKGSLSEVCDNSSGQCPCKNNSAGLLCDGCKSGYFYLTSSNPEGCTNCVCMGITANCSSTTAYRKQREVDLAVWSLVSSVENQSSAELSEVSVMDGSTPVRMIAANISTNETLYWKAMSNFTDHSLVEAYGGNLSFKLYFKQLMNGTLHSSQPKVILKGVESISIEHVVPSVSAEQLATRTVLMKESSWVHSGSSSAVSREDFLLVLARLQGLLITASFYSDGQGTYLTSLGDVKIAEVDERPSDAGRAYDVEQCSCGVGYSGLSCERCARGYHRVNVSNDIYLGKCEKCNCNGHSEDCDPATGQCLNCAHNTTGFHCEICLDSFYGNATDGTPGDCKKCPCESPRTATALCVGGADGQPKCLNCSEGYQGDTCGSCVLGFFGEPLIPGGNCSRCQCNNNSDVCNTTTGECLNCQHNTTGFHCERCENGTWGNATQQQCQACVCDRIGAHHNVCNHVTGQCACKPRVAGLNCSSCEPYSYNFTSSGCMPCGCNQFGSSSLQCNESGICECNNHTLGEKCDLCEWGFFGLPNATCQACRCNETGAHNFSRCDRTSGQCNCKPGVTSRTCDRCMIQHTNFSGNGCDPCPLCSRLGLQGDINTTLTVLKEAQADADTVSNLKELWPELIRVEQLITDAQQSSAEFDEIVKGLLNNITQLKDSELNKTISDLQVLLSSTSQQSASLRVLVSRELSRIQDLNTNTQSTKNNVTELSATVADILTQLTSLKTHADSVLAGINGILRKSYDSEVEQVNEELRNVQSASTLAVSAKYNVTAHKNMSESLNKTAMEAEGSLLVSMSEFNRMGPRIDAVTSLTNDALSLMNQTKSLISEARSSTDQALQLLQTINGFLNSSDQFISTGQANYQDANGRLGGLRGDLNTLDNAITAVSPELSAANQSVMENATKHAASLTAEARQRQSVFNTTLSHGARAVDAIKTFEEVVRLGNQSLETSHQANRSLQEIMNRLQNLTLVSSDLQSKVASSKDESEKLLNKTLARDANLPGLRGNVTSSNQTYMKAITTGASVDDLYSTLRSKRDLLVQAAEVGSSPHSVVSNAKTASDLSNEATFRSNAVNGGAKALLAQVNRLEQQMQFINESAERAAALTSQAFDNVRNASMSLGSVDSTVQRADELKNVTATLQAQLRQNMTALEEKLRKAREYVAKIRLALNVQGNTAVQYRPTSRLINKTSYTEISVDFRASRVQGSLFYLSDGSSSAARSLALTIESGSFVKFQYNLGTGPIDIINWAVRVQPGHWYTAYATRYEKAGRLTVTDHSRNFSRTYEGTTDIIPAHLTTDFGPTDHLYVGGLPDGVMINKTDRYFEGCIDNVVLNQESLNLWDPVKVEGNRTFCSRRPPVQVDVIPGTSFFGIPEGHVKQKMGDFNITGESEMEFQFRSFLKTAFITSVLNGQNYVYGVYLNESKVALYFKTPNDTYTVHSNLNSYSDGRWYRVHVVRGLRNASLTVRPVGPSDSAAVDYHTITTPTPVYLPIGQALLFGGKSPNSPINAPVSSSFAGALRWINISSSSSGALMPRALNSANYTESFKGVHFSGVLPRVEQGTRFLGQSYAAVETGQRQMTSLTLTFKTLSPSGVLVYSGEGPFFYLALLHGNLFLVYSSNLTTSFVPVMSETETLNDGAYHTVKIELGQVGTNVLLNNRALSVPSGFPLGPVRLNGSLWIGGVDNPTIIPRVFPVINAFEGDMKELKLNRADINIFSGRSQYVSLAGVPPPQSVVPTAEPTTPPPTLPPPTCGTPYPPLRNGSGEDEAQLQGSDYIAFSSSAEVLNYTRERFVISVRFRSLAPSGVLLYAANDLRNPTHFISLELVNGRLVFKQNAGVGTVRVASRYSNYSDGGIQYTVRLLRINQFGALLVSNKDYNNNRQGDQKTALVINSPFYYGGVPPGINMSALESNGVGFIGCLGPLSIQNAFSQTKTFNPRTDRDSGDSSYSYKPCYSEIQSQAGFNGDGHIIYDADYSLPDKTDIEVSFRTTTRSGLLVSITNSSGPGSVTLEQLYGQVILIFNGEGNSSVIRWTDPSIAVDGQHNASFHLCNNKFHKVVVRRNFSNVEFQVDEHAAVRGTVPAGFSLQHGTFYIGGVPDGTGFQTHSGMSHKGLTGCVQALTIDGHSAGIIRNTRLHNVQRGCNAPRVA